MAQLKTQLVLLGPPGAGKGTQARLLARRHGFTHISTGRILRKAKNEDSELGRATRSFIDAGRLVPDTTMNQLVEYTLSGLGWMRFVLDGYPRTLGQARWLSGCMGQNDTQLDGVLCLSASEDLVVRRLSLRRVHRVTGENFHLESKPPIGVDPSMVVQRADDQPAAIRERMNAYYRATRPVADFYRARNLLYTVDAAGSFEEVFARIHAVIA